MRAAAFYGFAIVVGLACIIAVAATCKTCCYDEPCARAMEAVKAR